MVSVSHGGFSGGINSKYSTRNRSSDSTSWFLYRYHDGVDAAE